MRRFVSCFFFKSVCIFVHDDHDHDNHDRACRHGGMCRARRHGFYCECLPGFMGTRCEGLFRLSFSSQCSFSNTDSMITIVKAISVTKHDYHDHHSKNDNSDDGKRPPIVSDRDHLYAGR